METEKEIYFYRVSDKFGYMSNFYKTIFKGEDGTIFNCSEQYFMYHKCKQFDPENKILINLILKENNPMKIKFYGRQVQNYDNAKWLELRYTIMVNALRFKFGQNPVIKNKLLSTENKIIYEASQEDKVWGIGFYDKDAINVDKNTFGLNLLGNALMDVRLELQNNSY